MFGPFDASRILADLKPPPPPDPFRYHFFVSYTTRETKARQVLPIIDALIHELRSAGFW
jgi:hypothetical protein